VEWIWGAGSSRPIEEEYGSVELPHDVDIGPAPLVTADDVKDKAMKETHDSGNSVWGSNSCLA
jgi:hypothetical protein